jgi:beta-glucosidase/6-phospho-beta-glucosidase/beta-galactosidase
MESVNEYMSSAEFDQCTLWLDTNINSIDQVKWWITLNEPNHIAWGYATETKFAPAVNAVGIGDYMATYTMLIAHANAYRLYDRKFRKTQQGGFTTPVFGQENCCCGIREIKFMYSSITM